MQENEKLFDLAFKLFKKKEFSESLCLVEKLLDNNKECDEHFFNILFLKGDLCHELLNYSEAVKVYSEILKYKKGNDNAFANRALAYWELKEYRKALKDYLRAVKLNNSNPAACYGAGEMYLSLNKHKKAIFMLERSIRLRPEYGYAYAALGEAYYQLSEWGTAYGYFLKAKELNEENVFAKRRIDKIDNYFKAYEKRMGKVVKK